MLNKFIKPRTIVTSVIILLVGVLAAIIVSQVWQVNNPVTIDKIPADAKLFINDKEIQGDRTNLANGTYSVRAEKTGFATNTQTIVITDTSKAIVVSLTPESDDAKEWAENNSNAYLQQEGRAQQIYGEAGRKNVDQNPIIEKLPINNYTYNVGYTLDQNDASGKTIIITVDAYEGYRNAAVRSLSDIGFDPGDYNIRFDNYTNPFSTAGDKQ